MHINLSTTVDDLYIDRFIALYPTLCLHNIKLKTHIITYTETCL